MVLREYIGEGLGIGNLGLGLVGDLSDLSSLGNLGN
jgi:hypothetical protein